MDLTDTDAPPPVAKPGWRYYLQQKILVIFFLGFSAGLSFPLVYSTLSGWLEEAGLERSTISTFAWLGFAYAFKFIWAPLVDSISLPVLTRWLGRRRAWLFLSQAGLVAALMLLSDTDPANALRAFTFMAIAVAFLSATQDIVLDAYRIEIAEPEMQGVLAAAYQYGYRVAILIGTAGALYLAEYASWSVSYKGMAMCMAIGLITTLLCNEPVVKRALFDLQGSTRMERLAHWFKTSVVGPINDIFERFGHTATMLLLFVALFRISDYVLGILALPFYLDTGFSKAEVATVAKLYGTIMSLVGIAGGGWAVLKFGVSRCVIMATTLIATTNLFFAALAIAGENLLMLAATISADNFAMGFAGTVFIAYLSSLTNISFTATQYALFSSLSTFFGKLTAGYSGEVQESIGWVGFFLYAAALGVPAIILSILLVRRERQHL
jgi:PAT family beta-lactamase induction signal transducer AmpG